MSDATSAVPVKKGVKAVPAKKAEHPPVATMVPAAIKALGDKKGSSLAAIKKYINGNYKVDIDRLAPFIRKYLKKAVETGAILQTKGSGASGSFKLAKKEKDVKPKEPATKKPAKVKKPKSPAKAKPKKAKTPKKDKSAKSPKKPAAKKPAKKTPKKAATKKTPKKPAAKKPAKK